MNNIPKKLRKQLAEDPEYSVCMLTGEAGKRGDPIEWHHALIFAGRQVQERFAIIPIKRSIHHSARNTVVKEFIDWIMLNRMSEAELTFYSKAVDLFRKRDNLNALYGIWRSRTAPDPYAINGIRYPWLREEANV